MARRRRRASGGASGSPAGHEAPVFDLDALTPGQIVEGPAIVESATTTALLRPGDRARATEHGWLDIAIASRSA